MPSPVSIEFNITNYEQDKVKCEWRLVAGANNKKKYENNGFLSIQSREGMIINVKEILHLSRVVHLLR
jgi:hypothetical protein